MQKMNTIRKEYSSKSLAILLVVSVLMWTTGIPFWVNTAHAATLTSVKDTLSDSRPSVVSNHVINFTTTNAVTAAQTIKIQFDPAGDLFNLTGITTSDIATTGMTLVSTCTAAASEVTFTLDAAAPDENLLFTVCTGDTVAAGAKIVDLSGTNKITNPTAGSFVIRITTTATLADSGDLRVAIIAAVDVTASVDTTLTFTITGVASGSTNANGEAGTTDVTTTSTTIPWGTVAIATAKRARQDLAVTTNARNGFVVTIYQNQNLLSANGADIDIFRDGTDGAPQAWAAPLGTLDSENTYGHEGITSEDSTISGGDPFGTALYDAIGVSATPISVFSHTGPADGTTADKGATKIGFKVEIHALQEAATDYNQRLTYVATPTF